MFVQQPPSHKQRGLPGPARGRKPEQEQRIHEIDHLIRLKQERAKKSREISADPRTSAIDVEDYKRGKLPRPDAKRLEEDFVDEELGHEGLHHEIHERQGMLDANHQTRPTRESKKEHRRKRLSESKQRRLSHQTGIENRTGMSNLNRLIGSK